LFLVLLQMTFPRSNDWSNPDRVQYGTGSVIGAPGTYNHLTDAILDVTVARAMYMRRLRTLADKYYGQNRLRQVGMWLFGFCCLCEGQYWKMVCCAHWLKIITDTTACGR
jgi:hypothetical protein